MLIIPLIPLIAGTLASTAVGIAVDNAAKIIIPPAATALGAVGIKAGTAIVGLAAGFAVSRVVRRNVESVVLTTIETPAKVAPAKEDN